MAIAVVAWQTCMATRCVNKLPVHRLWRATASVEGQTVQAVTLQHLATMRRHNSLGRARGVAPTHSDPHQMTEGTGPETTSSSTSKCQGLEARSPGERESARPRVMNQQLPNCHVNICHGKVFVMQFHPGTMDQLYRREGCHTRQRLVCVALGGLVDIERGNAS